MPTRNRTLSVVLMVSYLLAVTTSGLFHEHGGHEEGQFRPGVHASDGDAEHDCPVCQFLAHKPTPVVVAAIVGISGLVWQVAAPATNLHAADVFSAWQSRAPPQAA